MWPMCVRAFQSSGINTSLATWACMGGGGEGSIEEVFQDLALLQAAGLCVKMEIT